MKFLFVLTLVITSFGVNAQQPFEKDKKWGLSMDGTGDKNDSILFRAEFDKIEQVGDVIYAGLKNDQWQFLTSNKLVNQQRYETVEAIYYNEIFIAIGKRTGYLDIIDVENSDFVVRGVQADEVVNSEGLFGKVKNQILVKKGDYFGLINIELKKETLKAKYTRIAENRASADEYSVLAYVDGANYICKTDGTILFQFKTQEVVVAFEEQGDVADCYLLHVDGKKGSQYGLYDAKNKWVIAPVYDELQSLDNTSDAIVVIGKKGKGLFFQGKELLPCEYLDIMKSDKRGYVAKVVTKKGEQYVTPDGKFKSIND